MKKLSAFAIFCLIGFIASAQFVYKIKGDSILLSNDTCNTELILENSTRNVCGFLFNKGDGRTEFKSALVKLNDSTYVVGCDTLKIKSSSGTGYFTPNQTSNGTTTHNANYQYFLVNNLGRSLYTAGTNGNYSQIFQDSTLISLYALHNTGGKSSMLWVKPDSVKIFLSQKKLIIDSLQQGSSNDSILVWNKTSGYVGYRNASSFGISGITADNGLIANTSTNVQLFGTSGTPATLTTDRYLTAGSNTLNITYNSLAGTSGLKLTSTSTAAASNAQKMLEISLSGANSSQTTYGSYISNTHTGTSSTNIAGYFSASGGTNNYGLVVPNGGGWVGVGISPSVLFHVDKASYNVSNVAGANSVAIISNNISLNGTGLSGNSGITAQSAVNYVTLSANQTITNATDFAASNAVTQVNNTNASTLTINQASPGIRTMSVAKSSLSFGSFNPSSVITHASNFHIASIYGPSVSGTITNYYALLIEDQTHNASSLTLTNRYGIYQEGALDNNFFKALMYLDKLKTGSTAPTTSGTTKMVITDTNGLLSFADIPFGGSGEANTASNLTGTGIGIFKDKSGVDLRFKRLKAGTGISITDNTDSVTIANTGMSNPMTTLGDIIYENSTPTPARLAGNTTTTKQFLSQTGTGSISAAPVWDQVNLADVHGTNFQIPYGNTSGNTLTSSSNLVYSGGNVVNTGGFYGTIFDALKAGGVSTPASGHGTFWAKTDGKAYFTNDAGTIYDLTTGFTNPMTTLGDIIYGASSGTATGLAGNTTTNKRFLSQKGTGSVSAAPTWDAVLENNATSIDPANLTASSGETHTLTVTGAALGDYVQASFSIDLQGMTITAWVSAANTVSYRFVNTSGGTLNLGSGTVKVRVWPQ